MEKLLIFSTIVTVFSVFVDGQTQITESVCTNPKGEYRPADGQKSDNYWTLSGDTCQRGRSALVVQFTEMNNLYTTRYCRANVRLSAIQPVKDLCRYPEGTCFVLTGKNAPVDSSMLTTCTHIEWIIKDEILPLTVRFNRRFDGSYSFAFNYSYYENEDVRTTTETPTTTVVSDGATSDKVVTESTSSGRATESLRETEKMAASDEKIASYIAGIAVLSILLILAIAALLFVLARQNKDLVEKWLKMSKKDETPSLPAESTQPHDEQVYSDVYGVANEVYHEVEFGNEKETVDNQLYGMV